MPEFSENARRNLAADARVQGHRWNETYGGYFSDPKNFRSFIRAAKRELGALPDAPRVLYAGSGPGLLGEAVCDYLRSKGKRPELVLVDVSKEHMDANPNPQTAKVQQDLLHLELPGKPFDLAIMRSTLDYFPTLETQKRVLSNVARHLAPGGVLLHQPVQLPDEKTRNMMDAIYASSERIGRRHFGTPDELASLHRDSGFRYVRARGFAAPLIVTDVEHARRYAFHLSDIAHVRKIILTAFPQAQRQLSANEYAATTHDPKGYTLRFDFPILVARKPKKIISFSGT